MPRSDRCDLLQPLANLHAIHCRGDRREGAENVFHRHALLEGLVALRIKRVRRGHAAAHPDQDAGVRGGLRMGHLLVGQQARRAHGHRRGRGGGELLQEVAARVLRIKRQGSHGDGKLAGARRSDKHARAQIHAAVAAEIWLANRPTREASAFRFKLCLGFGVFPRLRRQRRVRRMPRRRGGRRRGVGQQIGNGGQEPSGRGFCRGDGAPLRPTGRGGAGLRG